MDIDYNNIVTFKYKNRSDNIRGFVCDLNDDWTILHNNSDDFIIDGFKIIKNKYVKKYKQDDDELFLSDTIRMKGYDLTKKVDIDLEYIFLSLKKYDAIQLESKDESTCMIGKILEVKNKTLKLRLLDPNGNWDEDPYDYKIKSIRSIELETDYINTLLMVNKNKAG